MSKNIYDPGSGYWSEIARLDTLLFEHGMRNVRGLLGKIAVVRNVAWLEEDRTYVLKTARLKWAAGSGRWLSSHLCQYEGVPTSPQSSTGETELEDDITREVIYNPVQRGGYVFGDYQDFLQDSLDEAEQKHALRQSRKEQNRAGLSLPTVETYDFILHALTVAESAAQ